ncbi:MAG TPA: hypothetical protein VLA89_00205, partial [Gemmatimonadales bacterium]|nr:hypothetical protein [Gemmatimonadales bacterium]
PAAPSRTARPACSWQCTQPWPPTLARRGARLRDGGVTLATRQEGIEQIVGLLWGLNVSNGESPAFDGPGIMLRHFAAFRASLEELRDTGRVTLGVEAERVEGIVELLAES